LAWSEGQQLHGSVLHSSDEQDETLQWLCHDDSTINIAISSNIITIIVIIMIVIIIIFFF